MCALKFPLAEHQGGEDRKRIEREKRMERESKMAANYANEMSMDMDATCNFPPQVMSSSSLLHLGNGFFCFVLSGMSPHPEESNYQYVVEDKGKRVISIVVLRPLGRPTKSVMRNWT